MKIAHIADSHLGASSNSRKLTPEGWNQREEDFLHIFDVAVERMIELKPDLVIHAGDLFHMVRPTNRVIARAARALLRLSEASIPTVVISGNHDTPKSRSSGSVFQIMDIIPGINFVYRNSYERFRIGDAVIHAVPHCLSQEDLDKHLEAAEPDPDARHNILVLHGVVSSIPEFSMSEFSEQFVPDSAFPAFDYVALGHYHRFTEVASNCFYAGSSERVSFSEAGQDKGFMEISLPGPSIKFHKLPARKMFKLTSIDAADYDGETLRTAILERIESGNIDGAISRLEIKNLPSHLATEIPRKEANALAENALQFDIKVERSEDRTAIAEQSETIGGLETEFADFMKRTVVEGSNKDELAKLGLEYFQRVRKDKS